MEDDTTTTGVDPEGEAAFSGGFEGPPAKPTPTGKEPPTSGHPTGEKKELTPEYVQITKARLEAFEAAIQNAEKISQKAFGTAGKVQQLVNELRSQNESQKVERSSVAYRTLEEQFPELAHMTKEAFQNARATDDEAFERKLQDRINAREMTHLVDEYPDWGKIVGQPPALGQPPNEEAPFRKWLAGKDDAYKQRITQTDSPAELQRAISRFHRESRSTAKPQQRPDARTQQLRDAVQPRGDGAAPNSSDSLEAAFAAGFRS